MKNRYYVYKVFLKDEVIYVGKGQGDRSKHVLSGKSHNFKLNEYYFKHTLLGDTCPVVKKVKFFDDELKSLAYETHLIKDLLPVCNIKGIKQGNNKSDCKVTKLVTNTEEDYTIDLPDNYEDFIVYAENLYKEVSVSWVKPQTFRTWIYSKKIPASWFCFHKYIDKYLEETPDARESNGGSNKNTLVEYYDISGNVLKAFNNYKYNYRKSKQCEPSEQECITKINKLKEKYNV